MKRISIYFPDDLHEEIRTKAFHERTSINKLVLAAVRESLPKGTADETLNSQSEEKLTGSSLAVLDLSDLPPGTSLSVEVKGRPVALCNIDGTVYALDGKCGHEGGPLGDGDLDGDELICPWHCWRFNVKTGASSSMCGFEQARYPVRVLGGKVHVTIQ